MKRVLILGAGGFIMCPPMKRLKDEGCWVSGVDLKPQKFQPNLADDFAIGDLTDVSVVSDIFKQDFDEVYQLAADMGGAGYIFTGENDADIMRNSASINLNVLDIVRKRGAGAVFFASSACVYPQENQLDPDNPNCAEQSVYPAHPDSEYGWEKLFSERLYMTFGRNYDLRTRIGRFHNVYGPMGTWQGGKEKAPAAMCRKVAEAQNGGEIEVWGDGLQTRSFLYIDDAVGATLRLIRSDITEPLNIGSEEMVSINQLAEMAIELSGKSLGIRHVPGPIGVRGRRSDNRLIESYLGWVPIISLSEGMGATYTWIDQQVRRGKEAA